MEKTARFGWVSVRDLSRSPGEVLDRVLAGERLIVRRYNRPIATLQPLSGSVSQPFDELEVKLDGSPLGDCVEEANALTNYEKHILTECLRGRRLVIPHGRYTGEGFFDTMKDMELRGLVRREEGMGHVITGRGMMLRELLLSRAARRGR